MRPDIVTVARKELRHILAASGGRRRSGMGIFVLPIILGLVIGLAGATSNLFFPVFFSASQSGGLVADSIAGERERHTLETLLATPAAESDILYGKLAATVVFGVVLAAVYLLSTALSATVVGKGPTAIDLVLVAVLSMLGCALSSTVAALCSINAETLRQATRRTGLVNLPVTALLGGGAGAIHFLPAPVAVAAMVALAGVDWMLLAVARHRFRRGLVPL